MNILLVLHALNCHLTVFIIEKKNGFKNNFEVH